MCEERRIDTREERKTMRLQQENELRDLLSLLYNLQFSFLYFRYHAFQTVLVRNCKLKI